MNVVNHRESIGQLEVGDLTVNILKDSEDPNVVILRTIVNEKIFELNNEPRGLLENLTPKRSKVQFSLIGKVIIFLAYNFYFGFAIFYHVNHKLPDCKDGGGPEGCWMWCSGIGVIIIITLSVYSIALYKSISNIITNTKLVNRTRASIKGLVQPIRHMVESHSAARFLIQAFWAAALVGFFVWDTWGDQRRLISAAGLLCIISLCAVFSKHPRHINWSQVIWGLILQLAFALLILRWELGKSILACMSDKVQMFLGFTDVGSGFVFGHLSHQRPFITRRLVDNELAFNITTAINDAKAISSVVVFRSLPVIYFFCFVVNILFYFGAIQWITTKLGYILWMTIATTPCESMNAAANIFLGQSVAPLLIKPYFEKLTRSEIHAIITSGFATISGNIMAAYIVMGVSPAHLLSASFMSAPAALVCAKILYPETEMTKLSTEEIQLEKGCEGSSNIIDAATRGATEGAVLVLNIVAIVIACIASVAFLNTLVEFLATLVGLHGVTFEWLLGMIFVPIVYMMGVEWGECEVIAKLVGIKSIVNEFIAYQKLGEIIASGGLSQRAATIATYALCGFANPGSIGITLAVLGGMCPARRGDCSNLVVRASVAGTLACFMTACIAGVLSNDGIVFTT